MPGVFITATDTELGKTAVACALALLLRRRGLDVGVMKPVASGCRDKRGGVRLEDAEQLRAASGSDDDLSRICPVALPEPLSPHLAAERAGVSIERERIRVAFDELLRRHEILIVEGVGGLLAPIAPDCFVADMAAEMGLPLLVVTRWGLGTLNHTLLTVSEARRRGLEIIGLIVNECVDREHGVAETTAPGELRRMTNLTVLAQIPFHEADDPADLYEQMARQISHLAVDEILRAVGIKPPPATLEGIDGPLPGALPDTFTA